MKFRSLIILLGVIILTAGCRFDSGMLIEPNKRESNTNRIDNPQLAKLILTPKRERLRVARDPFKPLVMKSGKSVTVAAPKVEMKVQYLGTLKVSDQNKALLRVNGKKGFYVTGDKIQGYTINNIDTDQLILTQDDQKLKIKRSDD